MFMAALTGLFSTDHSIPPVVPDANFLPTYRALRDQTLATTFEGQRSLRILESYTSEGINLFKADISLAFTMGAALVEIQPVIQELIAGNGVNATLTATQVAAINKMLDAIAVPASSAFRDAIAAERTKWGPLENYIGRSVTEIQQALLGYGVYLPRVTSSSTLVLTNASANETRATLDWTDSTGKIVASAEKILSPQGGIVVAAPAKDFTGAARVLSDRLVRAFVVNRGTDGGALDAYEGAVPGKRVTVPFLDNRGVRGQGLRLRSTISMQPVPLM